VTGAELIAAERRRQINEEGWTAEHDEEHDDFELSRAACCYAKTAEYTYTHAPITGPLFVEDGWPWEDEWWKPSTDPIRNFVKAGALIAAEIDRLSRVAPPGLETT
jgi:hypothetical protein